jgi:hypothetical protein
MTLENKQNKFLTNYSHFTISFGSVTNEFSTMNKNFQKDPGSYVFEQLSLITTLRFERLGKLRVSSIVFCKYRKKSKKNTVCRGMHTLSRHRQAEREKKQQNISSYREKTNRTRQASQQTTFIYDQTIAHIVLYVTKVKLFGKKSRQPTIRTGPLQLRTNFYS